MLKRIALLLLLAAGLPWALQAQSSAPKWMPDSVYYLMPRFDQGYVFLRGKMPAQGKMNICAVDNTLRFIGPDGEELSATEDGDIVKVRIDSVMFLRDHDIFYRLYPLSSEMGVALQREVRIFWDAKEGAYGSVSQTSSIQQYGIIHSDGSTHTLSGLKEYPYSVSETLSIYKEGTIYPITRKNLRKLFPAHKDEIDAWFKAGNKLPETVAEALDFLTRWMD